jgi:hypothetical protein
MRHLFYGDEKLWTDTLRLHEVVEKNVNPSTALKVGLKVDAEALAPGILEKVDLNGPATTVALLKMNAVVGLQATVDANNLVPASTFTRLVGFERTELSSTSVRAPK